MNQTDESFISWVHLSVGSDFFCKVIILPFNYSAISSFPRKTIKGKTTVLKALMVLPQMVLPSKKA
jgi:hypothetical protein